MSGGKHTFRFNSICVCDLSHRFVEILDIDVFALAQYGKSVDNITSMYSIPKLIPANINS